MNTEITPSCSDGEKFWRLFIEPLGRISTLFLYLIILSVAVFFALRNGIFSKLEILSFAAILYISVSFSILNWRLHRTSFRAIFLLRNILFIYIGIVFVWSAWSINISYPGNAQYKSLFPEYIVMVLITACVSVLIWLKRWRYGDFIFSDIQKYLPNGKIPDYELYALLTNKGKWNAKKVSIWNKLAYVVTVFLGIILGKYNMGLLMLGLAALFNALAIGMSVSRMLLQYIHLQGNDLEVIRASAK